MKIIIDGFRNIEHIEYELTDGKHNFLFGLSGSGKSSISNSLKAQDFTDLDRTFGKNIAQSISINGKDRTEFHIECFDASTKERYFSEDRNNVLRLFLFEESSSLKKTRDSFTSLVQTFIRDLDTLQPTFMDLSDTLKSVKADKLLKNDKTLKSTALTNKIITELKRVGDNGAFKRILRIESSRYKWLKEGIAFYDQNTDQACPFCERTIRNRKMLRRISDIRKYDDKTVGEYKNSQALLERAMDRKIQESIESFEEINEALVRINHAVMEFDLFKSFLEKLANVELFEKKIVAYQPKYLSEASEYFKGFSKKVDRVNNQIDRINRQYEAAQKKTEEVLKNKSAIINVNLAILDVPYVLKVKYVSRDYNEYYLVHKDNPEIFKDSPDADNYVCMSEGEKVILSMLLFIEQCKKDNPDLIVFDDPVSSYDEYRRGKILKIIQKRLTNKTVLMLSHDQVFAKYALFQRANCRGRISYLNHFVSPAVLQDISTEDFVTYREYVISKVNNINEYLLKVAYLRGLFEDSHGSSAYGYLSAILHAFAKDQITSLLTQRGTTEDAVLRKIQEKTGVALEKYDEAKTLNIGFDSLDFYEKCLLARPFAEAGQVFHDALKEVFDELSDFLHVNQNLEIGLNPAVYHLCSRKLYSTINSSVSGVHSLAIQKLNADN